MQKYDVVIAGAGPGGLASAMLLARAGLKVKLLERKSQPGGRTSSIEADGFRFDLGPTFFLYPRVLGEIFETCGRHLMEDIPMVRLDPQYRLIFGSRKSGEPQQELNCTPNVEQMETALSKFCPADAANFQRFLSENRHKLAEFRPILESPFNNLKDTLSLPLLKLLPLVRPWASVDGDLKRYFSDERLRLAFSFQSKYLGMSPFRCPSLFTILSFLEYEYGVFHPIGGCSAVSEKMAEIAQELGVTISYDEPIEEILFEGKQVVGVRTPNGTIPTRRLVINADFAAAMEKLVPNRLRPRWTSQKLAKKRYSCSTYMLYLGIDGRYDHLAHHNIYISGKYSENLADIETRHRLSADPSVYVQNASITDPTLAPAGQSTLYVLAPVTHQHANVNWDVEKSRFRGVVMQQLAKLGMGDLEGRIRYEKVVTPADWQHEHAIYRGATFNLAHNLLQMLHLRPRNRFAEIGGMYLVGGGTHPGSGLPVIYESARITSKLLLEDMGATLPTISPRNAPLHDDHSLDRHLVAAR